MKITESNSAQQLIASIGLPEDFLDSLIRESDWSFVIKLHALFEAVISDLVVRRLGNDALQNAVSHLDFNDSKAGKVAFAKALDLIDSSEANFLRGLSELRNQLVHNVKNVNFDLINYLQCLDANQRKTFRARFGGAIIRMPDGEEEYEKLARKRPKLILYLAAYSCLLNLEFNMSNNRVSMLVAALHAHASK